KFQQREFHFPQAERVIYLGDERVLVEIKISDCKCGTVKHLESFIHRDSECTDDYIDETLSPGHFHMDSSCLLSRKQQFRRRFIKHRVSRHGIYDIMGTGRVNKCVRNRRVGRFEGIMRLIEMIEAYSLHAFRFKLLYRGMCVCTQIDLI